MRWSQTIISVTITEHSTHTFLLFCRRLFFKLVEGFLFIFVSRKSDEEDILVAVVVISVAIGSTCLVNSVRIFAVKIEGVFLFWDLFDDGSFAKDISNDLLLWKNWSAIFRPAFACPVMMFFDLHLHLHKKDWVVLFFELFCLDSKGEFILDGITRRNNDYTVSIMLSVVYKFKIL